MALQAFSATGRRAEAARARAIAREFLPLSWVFVPLALLLIAAPAVMCFLPDRHVERSHEVG